MFSIEEREQNLFNATDTMAQFYDEIETFLAILFGHMERAGYATKSERLRSGTFTVRNLTRRLLASLMVIYVKGIGSEDTLDDDEEQDDEEQDAEKSGKAEIPIQKAMRIPFVQIFLFPAKAIPSVRTLSSPMLYCGAMPWCTTPIEAESSLGPDSHHPIISLSGIPSAVMVLRILHPILASTLCAANPLARIAEPTIAL